jgi:hypothetical protein
LLLADELKEKSSGGGAAAASTSADLSVPDLLEDLAERVEMLADRVEAGGPNA